MMQSFKEAMKLGRLNEFVFQAKKSDVRSFDSKTFDDLIKKATKQRQLPDRTSDSRAPGGSTGKKTR